MSHLENTKIGYRPDIDGLRAIAVMVVVFFHAGIGLSGGFVGVDIFFVISGFLITSIIVGDINRGKFTYVYFWERRARRILPAMVFVTTVTLILGYIILLPHDFKELGQSVVAQSMGLANFYFWRESGYFATSSEIKPLLHMWSLAVEEQFYLLAPGLLVLTVRWAPKYINHLLWLLMMVSLLWSINRTAIDADSAFYLLPSRAWELLLGAVIAISFREYRLRYIWAEIYSAVGLILILVSVLTYNEKIDFPGYYAILPCIGAAGIILGNRDHDTVVKRILSLRPLVFIGLISYSWYLWHWPLFAYANYFTLSSVPFSLSIMLVGLSFVLSVFSWRYIETPFRNKSFLVTRKKIFSGSIVATVGLLVLGLFVHYSDGVRQRFESLTLQYADARSDRNKYRSLHHDLSLEKLRAEPRLLVGTVKSKQPILAIIGDSHGDALMPAFVKLSEIYDVPAIAYTQSATIPLLFSESPRKKSHADFYNAIRSKLTTIPTLKHVVLVARWSSYKSDAMNALEVNKTINALSGMGIKVWFVRQVPEPHTDIPRGMALANQWGLSERGMMPDSKSHAERQRQVTSILATVKSANFEVVDLSEGFYDGTKLGRVQVNGRALYHDDDHLSAFGAETLIPYIEYIFKEINQ